MDSQMDTCENIVVLGVSGVSEVIGWGSRGVRA